MKTILIASIVGFLAAQAGAQCPAGPGNWNLTGGRSSESFCELDGEPAVRGAPGNILEFQSWDGSSLGLQWRIQDLRIDDNGAELLFEEINENGDGYRIYHAWCTGGRYRLAPGWPWSAGPEDLHGQVISAEVAWSETILNWKLVYYFHDFSALAGIEGCSIPQVDTIEFHVSSLTAWIPELGHPLPADYPSFGCMAGTGDLLDVSSLGIKIDPIMPTGQVSWSTVKSWFR
ncbi:hypothetical protein KJ682_08125 [bacterium]|nr:hypothetical protein [bacterium]